MKNNKFNNNFITVLYTVMLLVGIGNIILMFHLMDTQGAQLIHYGILLLACWFTGIVIGYMHADRHLYRLGQWVLIGLALTTVYPVCLLWNLITAPYWLPRQGGNRWYYFHALGAVDWAGNTWLMRKLHKVDDWLGKRLTCGRQA
jgi:hypothetical protein